MRETSCSNSFAFNKTMPSATRIAALARTDKFDLIIKVASD